ELRSQLAHGIAADVRLSDQRIRPPQVQSSCVALALEQVAAGVVSVKRPMFAACLQSSFLEVRKRFRKPNEKHREVIGNWRRGRDSDSRWSRGFASYRFFI